MAGIVLNSPSGSQPHLLNQVRARQQQPIDVPCDVTLGRVIPQLEAGDGDPGHQCPIAHEQRRAQGALARGRRFKNAIAPQK